MKYNNIIAIKEGDNVLDAILYSVLFLMLLSMFNLIRYMLKIKKVMKMNKDNPNVKGISIINGEVKVIENIPTIDVATPIEKELVVDEICGKKMEKKDAYRIFKNNKEYFFCSWECREKFLEGTR